ncbi:MAG: hypothetical protein HGB15_04120 [Chlorobaculum sp.]|nr:hypothetical protein [Chlorobaculum sp.]
MNAQQVALPLDADVLMCFVGYGTPFREKAFDCIFFEPIDFDLEFPDGFEFRRDCRV